MSERLLSGTSPIFTNAVVNDALSATMRKSHAHAIPIPAPAATPFTAAMTGFSMVRMRSSSGP